LFFQNDITFFYLDSKNFAINLSPNSLLENLTDILVAVKKVFDSKLVSTFALKLFETCVFIANVISQDSELGQGLNKDVRELGNKEPKKSK